MFHCSTHRCSCRKCIPSRFTQTPAWLNMQAPGEHGGTHTEGYLPFVAVDSNMLPQSGPPWVPGSWASQMLDCRSHLVWNLILLQTASPRPSLHTAWVLCRHNLSQPILLNGLWWAGCKWVLPCHFLLLMHGCVCEWWMVSEGALDGWRSCSGVGGSEISISHQPMYYTHEG